MFLVAGPVTGFLPFIQILGWILLSVAATATIVTIYVHYRRKKRNAILPNNTEEDFIQATPEQVGYTRGDGEYVLFDHSGLITEYKNRLSFNHARYTALQHDFASLESRYNALATYSSVAFIQTNNIAMENAVPQIPKQLEEEVGRVANAHATQKKELETRLEQLAQSFQQLEQENESLLNQLTMVNGSQAEKDQVMDNWRDENARLKDQLEEQAYIKDILEEKNIQISFLQNQLEQRIKNQHQTEQARNDAERSSTALKEEFLQARDELDKLQTVICEKEEAIEASKQQLFSRQDQVTNLENILQETRIHNESLQAELADSRSKFELLQKQLEDERSRLAFTEEQLAGNRQTLRHLYNEFGNVIGEETQPPVIPLVSDYSSTNNA